MMNVLRDYFGDGAPPFRSYHWGDRPWNTIRQPFYWGGTNRKQPQGFPFEPTALDA